MFVLDFIVSIIDGALAMFCMVMTLGVLVLGPQKDRDHDEVFSFAASLFFGLLFAMNVYLIWR